MSIKHLVVVIVFLLCIISFFAISACKNIYYLTIERIIGDLDGKIPYDKYLNNFDNYLTSFITLYSLNTVDLYPEAMMPAVKYSYLYLMFFLTYILLFMFLFFPVPAAVLYNSFKE